MRVFQVGGKAKVTCPRSVAAQEMGRIWIGTGVLAPAVHFSRGDGLIPKTLRTTGFLDNYIPRLNPKSALPFPRLIAKI